MAAHGFGILTFLLAIPVIGAALLISLPRRQSGMLFAVALMTVGAEFLWSLEVFNPFDAGNGAIQLIERVP